MKSDSRKQIHENRFMNLFSRKEIKMMYSQSFRGLIFSAVIQGGHIVSKEWNKEISEAGLERIKEDMPFIVRDIVDKQAAAQPALLLHDPKDRQSALADAGNHLDFLLSSIEMESRELFLHYNRWLFSRFDYLNLPADALQLFYSCAKKTFEERYEEGRLEDALFSKLTDYIDFGTSSLDNDTNTAPPVGEENPFAETLSLYRGFVFSGNRRSAAALVTGLSEKGTELRILYKYIFQPFQLELGDLWHKRQISVAQEHYATAVSQLIMSLLYDRVFSTPKNGRILVGTCVAGELHEFGIRMICDYMESCGWDTRYLGASMPDSAILDMVRIARPHVVAISCTMTTNLPKARSLIRLLKSEPEPASVIVGGFPFNQDGLLWKKVGADACSRDFEEALHVSNALFDGQKLKGNL